MNEKSLVTVVLPCYNHEKYVRQAIESVLQQTYKNIQLLILDNGSTDGSRDIIREYEDRAEVIYFDENDINEGRKAFMNATRGEYFAIMTSDDMWLPEKLEKQFAFLERHREYDACFTWAEYYDESLSVLKEKTDNLFKVQNKENYQWMNDFFLNGNCLCCPSVLMRTEAYYDIYGIDVSYWQCYDFFAWLRFLLGGRSFYVMPEVLVYMRAHATAVSLENTSLRRNRVQNEANSIKIEVMEKISDDLFQKAFQNSFVNKEAKTHLELLCEKIMILLRMGEQDVFLQPLVLDFFYRHYNEPGVQETFKKSYGLERGYFNELCGKMGYENLRDTFFHQGYVEAKKQEKRRKKAAIDDKLVSIVNSGLAELIDMIRTENKPTVTCDGSAMKECLAVMQAIEDMKDQLHTFFEVFPGEEWTGMMGECSSGTEIETGRLILFLHKIQTYLECICTMQ